MAEEFAPLRIEYLDPVEGMTLVRQAPPRTAASFSATYVGPGGWAYDPPGSEGTARLVNELVTSAAGPYDRLELARRLDRAGATLSHQCAPETAEVTVWGPADVWAELLRLLQLVVQRPRFDSADVRRAHRQLLERQLRESVQPASRAERELMHRVFPVGHPYRESGLGTARTARRLGRSALVRFHDEHYSGDGGLLVVTAPVTSSALRGFVRRTFGAFSARRAPSVPRAPKAPGSGGEHRIDLPGRTQVEVRLGGPSIARSDPRFPAAFLANEVLGGRPLLARLFQRLREHGGLAYHASSDLEAMRWGGYWVAQAGTGAERWRKLLPMLERELVRLRRSAPSDAELELVRESAIGEIVLSLESTGEAHELAVDAGYHRLPPDHWVRWPEELRAVRPAEVRDAAREAMAARGAATIVAGPLGAG